MIKGSQGAGAGRALRIAVAAGSLLAMVQGVAARDSGGAQDFFTQMFSGFANPGAVREAVPQESASPAPATQGRPLTVRMHRRPARPVSVVAQTPVKPGKVSIFEDRTLRPGDAVMTPKGIRIFAGSNSWPYREADFVDLAEAHRMDSRVHKILADLDRLPHS